MALYHNMTEMIGGTPLLALERLGGNGTLIGASANVIVAGIAAREGHPISFLRFLIWSVPVMLLSVAMAGVFLYLEYFI